MRMILRYTMLKQICTYQNKSSLQGALISLHEWYKQNGILLNTEKTKIMIITTRQKRLHIDESILSLSYNDVDLEITTGDIILRINTYLTWSDQFHFVCKKVSTYVWLLSKIRYNLSRVTKLQKRAVKIILENEYLDFENAKLRLNRLSFEQSVFVNKVKIMFKVANSLIPQYVCDLFQRWLDNSLHCILAISFQSKL